MEGKNLICFWASDVILVIVRQVMSVRLERVTLWADLSLP